MRRIPRRLITFLRWLSLPEQLPGPRDDQPPADPVGQRFLPWLLAGDELGRRQPGSCGDGEQGGFLEWIISPEILPSPSVEEQGEPGSPRGFWSWFFSGEELPQYVAVKEGTALQVGFLRRLVSPEVCPEVPAEERRPSRGEDRFLFGLLGAESCPQNRPADCPSPPRQTGILRWLISPEECPKSASEGTGAAGRRPRFLHWLMSGEEL